MFEMILSIALLNHYKTHSNNQYFIGFLLCLYRIESHYSNSMGTLRNPVINERFLFYKLNSTSYKWQYGGLNSINLSRNIFKRHQLPLCNCKMALVAKAV